MAGRGVALGIDVGTSGVRAVALDAGGGVVAAAEHRYGEGAPLRDPALWWDAVRRCLAELKDEGALDGIRGLAVDGTSGTMLGLDSAGEPVGEAILYNDACREPEVLAAVDRAAPADTAARGATSALARAILIARRPGVVRVLHQADHIGERLTGRPGASDANNALKTGYDPVAERWPDWIAETGLDTGLLPEVHRPGTPLGTVGERGARLGLPADAVLHAGTTDGCASFLATGAERPGDGVTALGSTLVLKLLSDRPIFAPHYGIYSHRIGTSWLVGGASNTGGRVLASLFDRDAMNRLTLRLRPEEPTGLDYYPLLQPGERFPINDPALEPRLEPRPADEARFFQGLLEGIAAVEALGYRRLGELGAPRLSEVRTVGGGAANAGWSAIRQRLLGVPFAPARSVDAAAGTARLALGDFS